MKTGVVVCVALASAGLGALAAWPVQDAKAKESRAAQGQPSAEDQARWQKNMAPGPQHQALAEMVGHWKADVSYTSTPGAPPDTSSGTSDFTMIMDGRYLKNEFTGTSPMGPFKGLGLTGYNNATGTYEDTWLDAMGTGMIWSIGSWDGESDAIAYKAIYKDPMTAKMVNARSTMRKVTPDEYALQMYTKVGDAPEFLSLDIKYTRMK